MGMLFEKYDKLKGILSSYGSVAVAYSAGVDSTFLLAAARETLGERAVAVMAEHAAQPGEDVREAEKFCLSRGITLVRGAVDVLAIPGFSDNPPDRCYVCKKEIFRRIADEAARMGIKNVADGSNVDDEGDYRPGMRALRELGVKSPLREAGLTKEDVRALSRLLGLETWNKPSGACLATRVPYGEPITAEKLSMIGSAEEVLAQLGFSGVRVRCHGAVARIEVPADAVPRLAGEEIRARVSDALHRIGFSFVALDLDGYRTGSMNVTAIRDGEGV